METERLYLDQARLRCGRLRRTVKAAAEHLDWETTVLSEVTGRSFRKTFITLTYRNLFEWKPRHISAFVQRMRQWFARRGHACRFVWVGELQKRGALHYHLLVFVPRSLRLPRPDECGWWPHGMSKIETARSPVGYMVKYASKVTPDGVKRMPKGVRLHGNGGAGSFARGLIRARCRPQWLKDLGAGGAVWMCAEDYEALGLVVGQSLVKKCKGGFVNVVSDEVYPTPWDVRVDELGVRYLVRKKEVIE